MLRQLPKKTIQKVKHAGLWILQNILYIVEIAGIFGIIGTAGAFEHDNITIGWFIVQMLAIGVAMVFVGILIYIINEILPDFMEDPNDLPEDEYETADDDMHNNYTY